MALKKFLVDLDVDGSVTINDYTLPSADGSVGYIMKTDGAGGAYWGAEAAGLTVADHNDWGLITETVAVDENDWGTLS